MKNLYPKPDAPVKPSCPFLWGWKNLAINATPFLLIWLAQGAGTLSAALAAFFITLNYFLRENSANRRRLARMAKDLKERRS